MRELKHLTKLLREAEAELEAAKKRTEVDLAAARYMRIKAELKQLDGKAGASA